MLRLLLWFLLVLPFPCVFADDHPMSQVPTSYKGRIRPYDSAAKQWLYEIYNRQEILKDQRELFHTADGSALDLLLKLHFLGIELWEDAPLFYIHLAELKKMLGLPQESTRFSYRMLQGKKLSDIVQNEKNSKIVQEAAELLAKLHLFATLSSTTPDLERQIDALKKAPLSSREISELLETQFPLTQRLKQAGTTLKMLPSKFEPGEWLSLKALKEQVYDPKTESLRPIGNFTAYSDRDFTQIRNAYQALDNAYHNHNEEQTKDAIQALALALNAAYKIHEGKPYAQAAGKALYYPSENQLRAESIYERAPLIEITIFFYAAAALLFIFNMNYQKSTIESFALICMGLGFACHTLLLALRCYILMRPPVSNMFETVIYVPWITVLAGFILRSILHNRFILLAASLTSIILLAMLKLTHLNANMENVQAVLDSRYWLIIHVLMVVGSYGVFVLGGVLGHIYLIKNALGKQDQEALAQIGKSILQTMYVGLALLIPGTILGGVWAAESWGRFWDWDPKESWAFISICVYLLWVHAYTFHKMGYFGLAVGSVVGFVAISFTWYGVNYILGTGFHSYGFGSGGELYYYLYLMAELAFLGWIFLDRFRRANQITG